MQFICKQDVPAALIKDVMCGQFVCNVRPEKKERHRTWFVVGGNRTNYPDKVATPTAKMLVAKILFNIVILTPLSFANTAKFH